MTSCGTYHGKMVGGGGLYLRYLYDRVTKGTPLLKQLSLKTGQLPWHSIILSVYCCCGTVPREHMLKSFFGVWVTIYQSCVGILMRCGNSIQKLHSPSKYYNTQSSVFFSKCQLTQSRMQKKNHPLSLVWKNLNCRTRVISLMEGKKYIGNIFPSIVVLV